MYRGSGVGMAAPRALIEPTAYMLPAPFLTLLPSPVSICIAGPDLAVATRVQCWFTSRLPSGMLALVAGMGSIQCCSPEEGQGEVGSATALVVDCDLVDVRTDRQGRVRQALGCRAAGTPFREHMSAAYLGGLVTGVDEARLAGRLVHGHDPHGERGGVLRLVAIREVGRDVLETRGAVGG